MSYLYAMQRANGDVFALDDHGRFRVPVFHSIKDGLMARLNNFEMLLFKPVELDACLLNEIAPVGTASDTDLWLVNKPLINLNRGRVLQPAQLVAAVGTRIKQKSGLAPSSTDETAILKTSSNDEKVTL